MIVPDFILGNNPVKNYIGYMIDNKRKAISTKPYLYCRDCFNRDFDAINEIQKPKECIIWESNNILIQQPFE